MAQSSQRLDIPLADGAALAAEYFPATGDAAGPGVVVLHESFGLNADIRRIAGRFAASGYAALAPDLYSHGTRLVCLSRVLADMVSGRISREIADIHAAREALAARPEVDARRGAIARFCPGGGFSLLAPAKPRVSGAGGPH